MKIFRQIRLVYIASGISIAVLVVMGLLYMEISRDQVIYIDAVEHTYRVLSSMNFCEKKLIEAEAAQRGHLLAKEGDFKAVFESTLPLIDSSLKEIGEATDGNDNQKIFYSQLAKYVRAKMLVMKENIVLEPTDPLYYENLRQGAVVMDNCSYYMQKMRGVEEDLLKKRLERKNTYQRLNLSYFKAVFITACLICIIAIAIFFRELGIRLKTQQNLKAKINELSNSKHELEEITFAASHDLQEPMRKVRILSNLITKKFAAKLPEEDLDVVYRINKITEQMHGLLNDLVLYTNLLNPKEKYSEVNLYSLFKDAYHQVFKQDNVQLQVSPNLPLIYGSQVQLKTMLFHLLENALKFKDAGRNLIITVNYELKPIKDSKYFWGYLPSKKFHQLTITDNGIGFDEQYQEKIFGLFQRLHTQSDYPGKGIGLSIARRVMSNHHGYISAVGEKRVGASFILYFPVAT